MTLTPQLIALLRDIYLEYREGEARLAGRFSAQMTAQRAVLQSKLAVRARLAPAQANNPKLLYRNIRLQKEAQRSDNHTAAKNALTAFLSPGAKQAKHTPAHALEAELEWFGGYVMAVGPEGVKWIAGPLKKIDKAMGKTIIEYDYAWGSNKDLVRGTVACRTNEDLAKVATLIGNTCVEQYGMFLVKADNQKSVRDGGNMGSGYSGWNFVIQYKDHHMFGAEVQANTFDMLYGKHSKQDVLEHLDVTEAEYSALQDRLRFPGGLGHALYDIQDTARSQATRTEGDWARELCLNFNDACRGVFRRTTLEGLNADIRSAASIFTSAPAKKLWKHAVEGSGWNRYQIPV